MTLVRSPMTMKLVSGVMVNGSRPDRRVNGAMAGAVRGASRDTCLTMAARCSGRVPQQPPIRLTQPWRAKSPMTSAMCSGVSSYWPNSLGRPALG